MLDGGTSHAPLRLIARPHLERGGFHLDRFDAYLGGELITTSRQPLLDGARALLARGFDPDAMLTMRLASSAADSFRPKPIRQWARWTITERDRGGLQRTTWRPFADARGSHAAASPRGKKGLAEGEGSRNVPPPLSTLTAYEERHDRRAARAGRVIRYRRESCFEPDPGRREDPKSSPSEWFSR